MKSNKTRKKVAVRIEEGSGNIFRDIGVKHPEEALMKAKIAMVVGKLIRAHDMTQVEIAAKLGIDQPKVSMLLRGQLKDFSVERLFRFVSALEQDITITIRPHRKHLRGERISIEMAA